MLGAHYRTIKSNKLFIYLSILYEMIIILYYTYYMKDKGINTEIFFYNNSFDLFLLGS